TGREAGSIRRPILFTRRPRTAAVADDRLSHRRRGSPISGTSPALAGGHSGKCSAPAIAARRIQEDARAISFLVARSQPRLPLLRQARRRRPLPGAAETAAAA